MSEIRHWRELFDRVGDSYLHPKQYGDCFFPVSIEEMYQAFKARLQEEMRDADQSSDVHD